MYLRTLQDRCVKYWFFPDVRKSWCFQTIWPTSLGSSWLNFTINSISGIYSSSYIFFLTVNYLKKKSHYFVHNLFRQRRNFWPYQSLKADKDFLPRKRTLLLRIFLCCAWICCPRPACLRPDPAIAANRRRFLPVAEREKLSNIFTIA